MKKALSLLSLAALTIGLLGSCSKINERIDGLDKRVYDLEHSKIASAEQQITAINTSITDLKAADETIGGKIGDLKTTAEALQTLIDALKEADKALVQKDEALEARIATLEGQVAVINGQIKTLEDADKAINARIDELKSYIDTELGKTKDWASATFATLEEYRKTAAELATLSVTVSGISNTLAAVQTSITTLDTKIDGIDAALQGKIADAKTELEGKISDLKTELEGKITEAISTSEDNLKGWVNEQLSGYYTIAQVDAKVDGIQSDIDALKADNETNKTDIKKLKADLDKLTQDLATAKNEIKTAYEKAISDAINGNNGYINSTIKNAIDAANADITALTGRVETLESDVATLKNDVDALKAMIQTVSIIPAYSNGSLKAEDGILTINCVITPKKAVESLTKENFTILTSESEVLTKSALYGTLTIAKDEDLVLDKTNGTATIKVDVSGVLPTEEDKALTVAVNIKSGISDFTTEFVPVTVAGPDIPEGALPGVFSVSASKQVQFSKGNLVATIDAAGTPTAWKFAANQYDCLGEGGANKTIGSAAGDVDLFGWSTAATKYGISTSTTDSDYSGDFVDWGKNIGDGSTWRTLSKDEWTYLFKTRTNASGLYKCGVTVCGKTKCVVIAPDGFTGTIETSYDATAWATAEAAGLVCLPAAGTRYGSDVYQVGDGGYYWSSSAYGSDYAYRVYFGSSSVNPDYGGIRSYGSSVRLITEPGAPAPQVISVESVSLNKSTLELAVGSDETLTATVTPENATDKNVSWRSSDESAATVDASGKVTAVAAGTATITVTTEDGGKTAICKVTVLANIDGALSGLFSVSASKQVQFSKGNLVATIDASGTPTAWKFAANQYDCLGEGGANKTIGTAAGDVDLFGWSTAATKYGISTSTTDSDYSGDFVDWGKNIGDGSTWRTLSKDEWTYLFKTRTNASGLYKCGVTVCGKTKCVVIAPDGFTGTIETSYDATAWATAEAAGLVCLPAAGYRFVFDVSLVGDYGFYWSSTAYDESGAYGVGFNSNDVFSGSSDYRNYGSSVRLITEPGAPAPQVISVESVSLNKSTLELAVGSDETLTATVTPENATDKNVSWSSSDESVATVDASGKVTAVAAGTATITVTTTDGGKKATCAVTVDAKVYPVESVSLDKTTLTLTKGDKAQLIATVKPDNATDKTVSWISNNPVVAAVNSEGNVVAVTPGEAIIYVITVDGAKTATCKVTVLENIDGALPGLFSVSDTRKVRFSKGNLQAIFVGHGGLSYSFRFAENQYDCIGDAPGNTTIDESAGRVSVDLFGWSTESTYYGISTSTSSSDYSGDFLDWGKKIGDGSTWRTLSNDEWVYLFETRTNASGLYKAGVSVCGKTNCVIIAPDGFTGTIAASYDATAWATAEAAGLVCLPAAGSRYGSDVDVVGGYGFYWSSTACGEGTAYLVRFGSSNVTPDFYARRSGSSVRLITDVK